MPHIVDLREADVDHLAGSSGPTGWHDHPRDLDELCPARRSFPAPAPGEARTAALLGFVDTGLGTGILLGVLTVPGSPTYAGAALLTTPAITALLLVGSFSVLRGTGRRVLLGASAGEILLVLGLAGWSLAAPLGPYAVGTGDLLIFVVLVSVTFGTALPAVRLISPPSPSSAHESGTHRTTLHLGAPTSSRRCWRRSR